MARSILKTTGAKIFQLVKDFYLGISNSYVAKARLNMLIIGAERSYVL